MAQDARFCSSCGNPNNGAPSASPVDVAKSKAQQGLADLRTKKWFIPAVAVAGVLIFVGIVSSFSGGGLGGPNIKDAVTSCGIADDTGVTLASDGSSVYLDGNGNEDFLGVAYSDTQCVLETLEAPETIYSRISNTNSLMGEQDMSWGNFRATWTYHPDNGLDLGIEVQK